MIHKQSAVLYLLFLTLPFLFIVVILGFGDVIYTTINPPPIPFAASETVSPSFVSVTPVYFDSVWSYVLMLMTSGVIVTTFFLFVLGLWKVQSEVEPTPTVQPVRDEGGNRPNNLLIEQSQQTASYDWLADFVARYDN